MITEYIRENAESDWKGCLMLSLPGDIAGMLQNYSKNNIDDLYLVGSGRENYAHCTILYGFDQKVRSTDVEPYVDTTRIDIQLGKVSRFECEDNDVIKIEVINSPQIHKLHHLLKDAFNVVTSYPTYNPHVTLAYVSKGSYIELDGDNAFDGMLVPCSEMTFSRGPSDVRKRSTIRYEDFKEKIGRN